MEENNKIELAKEVVRKLHEMAREYKSLADSRECELEEASGKVAGLEERIRELEAEKREAAEKTGDIRELSNKAAAIKDGQEKILNEINTERSYLKQYLPAIADDVDSLKKEASNIRSAAAKSSDEDDKNMTKVPARLDSILEGLKRIEEKLDGFREGEREGMEEPGEDEEASEKEIPEDKDTEKEGEEINRFSDDYSKDRDMEG